MHFRMAEIRRKCTKSVPFRRFRYDGNMKNRHISADGNMYFPRRKCAEMCHENVSGNAQFRPVKGKEKHYKFMYFVINESASCRKFSIILFHDLVCLFSDQLILQLDILPNEGKR